MEDKKMLILHVEADTTPELIQKTLVALGIQMIQASPVAAPPDGPLKTGNDPMPIDPADTTKRKPGRPKLMSVLPTAPSPVPGAPVTPAKPIIAAPAASVASPVVPTASVASPAVSSEVTYDQVKAALQKAAENREGESGTAGLERVRVLISKYGYRKVKDIKPEHYVDLLKDSNA